MWIRPMIKKVGLDVKFKQSQTTISEIVFKHSETSKKGVLLG